MNTPTEQHEMLLLKQGYALLGMVSPIDSYFVNPHTGEVAHEFTTAGGTRLFFDKLPQPDIFAILVACIRYERRGSEPAPVRELAEARMNALYPDGWVVGD